MPGLDDQDQSEVFDEDNTDASETGGVTNELKTFEEQPEVLDLTVPEGDADENLLEDTGQDVDNTAVFDRAQDGPTPAPGISDDPVGGAGADTGTAASGEVELVYAGSLDEAQEVQASAAQWEARQLDDDDIADLGYGPEGDEH
ncbi:hypothetical protein [Brevundimonas sp. R86498]|uniref:hypothetical protein n=1 Tax=Brevundimonas sp. R86498 TaxID=3093845 RepID=UPI0037C70239